MSNRRTISFNQEVESLGTIYNKNGLEVVVIPRGWYI